MIKKISRSLKSFTRKNKICYISLRIPYTWPSFSIDHQTGTIMNYHCYCLTAPVKWRPHIQYCVWLLWLKSRTWMEQLALPPALISNCRIAVIFLNSVNQVSSLLLVYLRWCAKYEVLWPPGRCIVKRMWTWNLCR